MMTKEVENLVGSLGSFGSGGAEGKCGETSDYFYQSALNPGSWGPSRQMVGALHPKSIKGNLFTILVSLTEKPSLCHGSGIMTCIPYHACCIQPHSLFLLLQGISCPGSSKNLMGKPIGI